MINFCYLLRHQWKHLHTFSLAERHSMALTWDFGFSLLKQAYTHSCQPQYGKIQQRACTPALCFGHYLRSWGQCLLAPNVHCFQDSSHLTTCSGLASHASKHIVFIFHNHYENRNMKQYQKQVLLENKKFHRNPTGSGSTFKTALRSAPSRNDQNLYRLAVAHVNPGIPRSLFPALFHHASLHFLKHQLKQGVLFYTWAVKRRLHQH